MQANVQRNMEKILTGQIKYSSNNLGFNMLIARLQKKATSDPTVLAGCIGEVEEFVNKYSTVMKAELDKIAAL